MRTMYCVLGLLAMTAAWAEDKPKTTKIESDKGGFSVEFPSKPMEEKDKTSESYILSENDDKQGYVVVCTFVKNKLDLTDEDAVKAAFSTAYTSMVKSLGRKATKVTAAKWGKDELPSKLYEFTLDDGVYHGRVILAEDRMVQCIISGPKEWASGDKAKAFMKSMTVKASVKK